LTSTSRTTRSSTTVGSFALWYLPPFSHASAAAWYEWYPDYAYDFAGISSSAGDTVIVTVLVYTATTGIAIITNESTGAEVYADIDSAAALCQRDAEWIVEGFESDGGLVPFANFGTVTFSGAQAGTPSGAVGPEAANVFEIEQGKLLTTTSVSGSSVTVSYV
jgi:hypothetical protein